MINEPLDFSQITVQENVTSFLDRLTNLRYLDSKYNLTESWLDEFEKNKNALKTVDAFFRFNTKTSLPLNVHQIDKQVYVSRYMVQTTNVKDATEEVRFSKSIELLKASR